ncbi:MAG: tail fiber domain-containing protein [Flavobacteriales bacterium]|nr:tail fiber domain-containing protein [Flavobacteriales bacterium]
MKTKITLLTAILFLSLGLFAQAPEGVNYQAVARDLSGNPMISTSLTVDFDIREISATGTIVYSQTKSLNTNQFGLFTAEIGVGPASFGTFPGIAWGSSAFYLQVTVNGDVMPATQLLSVPYALFSKTSGNGPPGAPGNNSLANATPEASGANCANGGTMIDVGVDDNGNGTLEALEIDFTYYVCNGGSGAVGAIGPQGSIGLTGPTGVAGPAGAIGPAGAVGATGPAGTTGATGSVGSQGPIGLTGPTGPAGLIGPAGPQGAIGLTGPTGSIGAVGATGAQGPIGLTGAAGAAGPQGPTGLTGATGGVGPAGPAGATGVAGPAGPIGATGSQGPTGLTGATGVTGPQGPIGLTGATGPPGTYTAGTAIDLTGGIITNTAPDQTVTLTGLGATTVSGTYPSFSINSIDNVNDADFDPTNEHNTAFWVNGLNLELTDGGGTFQVPLTSFASNDGDWTVNVNDMSSAVTGNVGIGVSPLYKLDVQGDINTSTILRLSGTVFVDDKATSTLIGATGNTSLTGVYNTIVGQLSGQSLTTGMRNTLLGRYSGAALTTESDNTLIGLGAGQNSIGGSSNTMIGSFAGWGGTNAGSDNTYVGRNSGRNNSTGANNTFVGSGSGEINTVGANNTAFGFDSGNNNVDGTNNTFLGYNTDASANNLTNATAIGANTVVSTSNSLILGNGADVGIRTSIPISALDVNGQITMRTGATVGYIPVSDAAGTVTWTSPSTVFSPAVWSSSAGLIFPTTLTDNVGIGTASPTVPLHVEGNTQINGVTQMNGTSGLAATLKVFGGLGAGVVYIFDGTGSKAFSVFSGGQVGIGSGPTGSTGILHIQDNDANTTGASGSHVNIQNLANTTNTTVGLRFRPGGSTATNGDFHYKGAIFFEDGTGTNGEGDMIFAVNNAASSANVTTADAAMTINTLGNIGIGTTAPTAKLSVNETSTNSAFRVQLSGGTQFVVANNGNTALYFNNTPAYKLTLNTNSAAKPTSNVWTVSSDARLKKDIKPYKGGLSDILKINPVWFTYNGKAGMPDDTGVGVIAQDLQKIAPYMVNTWTYVEGSEDEINPRTDGLKTDYLGVDNGAMTYMLINAVKEQQKMIEQLKKEIEDLKNNK